MVANSVNATQAGTTASIAAGLPDLMTVKDAQEEFAISRATIFRMLRGGELARYRQRGFRAVFIDRGQLQRLLKPRKVKG